MRIIKFKTEYYLLVAVWLFWGLSEITSWSFYDPNANLSVVIRIKFFQCLMACAFNWLFVFIVLGMRRLKLNVYLHYLMLTCILSAIALTTVLFNSTYYRSSLAGTLKFIEVPEMGINALQKMIFMAAFTGLFFMIRNSRELRIQKDRVLKAENLSINSQLQMLQQQVSPHFIFNTLNTLRSLINSDQAKARSMVTNLAELLRQTLDKPTLKISLREELETLEHYVEIQKLRWSDGVDVRFDIDKDLLFKKVPAFCIQPLVENCFKHGMKTGTILDILVLVVKNEDDSILISVRNNGKLGKLSDREGGNLNIQKRLELLYHGKSSFGLYQKEELVYADIIIRETNG